MSSISSPPPIIGSCRYRPPRVIRRSQRSGPCAASGIDDVADLRTCPDSAVSTQSNKARLRLLEKREELLEQLFDEARSKIGETTQDEAKYGELLKGLILQVRLLPLPPPPFSP